VDFLRQQWGWKVGPRNFSWYSGTWGHLLRFPHIDVYFGFFMDNWINFASISKTEDGSIEVHQPLLRPETKLGMVRVERDLGRTIVAILKNYRDKPQMMGKPIYCVGGQYSTADVVKEITNQTGREGRVVTLPTSGAKDLDEIYHYYNEWGVYRDVEIPHPNTTGSRSHLLLSVGFRSRSGLTHHGGPR
jgi:hypothetical protein